MALHFVNLDRIERFFRSVDARFGRRGRILLLGETSQLVEGWRRFIDEIEFVSVVNAGDRPDFNRIVVETALGMDVRVTDEHPGEVIPLPSGHEERERPLASNAWAAGMSLSFAHFDPYAVSFRYLARGGETDYQLVIRYLENGWIDWDEMTDRLDRLLPEFSFDTIQQDPAEFRRRYGGLFQMWKQRRPDLTRAPFSNLVGRNGALTEK